MKLQRAKRTACRGLVVLLMALTASGCAGEVVDQGRAEQDIEAELERTLRIETTGAECPSDAPVEADEEFECQVTVAGGDSLAATVKVVNDDADLEITGVKGE